MRHALIIAALLASPATAFAQDMDSTTLANQLGSVLAAEDFCGLTYDQDAIAAFIAANVAADDMSFPSMLGTMTAGHGYSQDDMSPSAKTAHCTQIARLAQANRFTP